MHCPTCQQPIAVGIKFCGSCGAPLQPAPRRSPSNFVLMMAGVAIGLLSLLFTWAPTTSYYAPSYQHYELKYSDGKTAQSEYLPGARNVGSGGGATEAKVLSTVLLLAAGGVGFWLRNRAWPRWAVFTLLGVAAFLVLIGVINGLYNETFGPFVLVLGALALGGAAGQALLSGRRTA